MALLVNCHEHSLDAREALHGQQLELLTAEHDDRSVELLQDGWLELTVRLEHVLAQLTHPFEESLLVAVYLRFYKQALPKQRQMLSFDLDRRVVCDCVIKSKPSLPNRRNSNLSAIWSLCFILPEMIVSPIVVMIFESS